MYEKKKTGQRGCSRCKKFREAYPIVIREGKPYHDLGDGKYLPKIICAFDSYYDGHFRYRCFNCQTMRLLRYLCGDRNDRPVGAVFFCEKTNSVMGVLPQSGVGWLILVWTKDSDTTRIAIYLDSIHGMREFRLVHAESILDSYQSHLTI